MESCWGGGVGGFENRQIPTTQALIGWEFRQRKGLRNRSPGRRNWRTKAHPLCTMGSVCGMDRWRERMATCVRCFSIALSNANTTRRFGPIFASFPPAPGYHLPSLSPLPQTHKFRKMTPSLSRRHRCQTHSPFNEGQRE